MINHYELIMNTEQTNGNIFKYKNFTLFLLTSYNNYINMNKNTEKNFKSVLKA